MFNNLFKKKYKEKQRIKSRPVSNGTRFLSYILISLVIGANLLAPISVGWTKNNLEVKSNKAEAMFGSNNDISLTETPSATDKTITINFSVGFSQKPARLTKEGVRITKIDPVSGAPEVRTLVVSDLTAGVLDAKGFYIYTNTKPVLFENLTPNTKYPITIEVRQINTLTWTTDNFTTDYWLPPDPIDGVLSILPTIDEEVTTNPEGITTPQTQAPQTGTAQNTNGANATGQPICWIGLTKGFQVSGCIAQGMYYLFFKPTSFVFAFAGQFLDMIFMYSISDTSYRSTFVVEGWGVVRDFCNMFFIFVLLYIAFKTILGLGASKTKEMVINVVIIGLLINFSLFATQVIIDASNILARVFYNQNTIVTGPKATGSGIVSSVLGPFGEIQLSSAVVAKVNPQELLMKSTTAGITQAKPRGVLTDTYAGDIDPGTFIITVLLATAVNVVGTIAFLSSALIFLGRVIMLWLAMILVPIAFFSYTIPALQDVKMIGWKKWWPDTLKMAFVAPVFAFFMYLIVGFLDKGLGIANATGKNGMAFVIAIVVPFVFIMILLMKAKDVAVSMSGEVGAAMSKAGAAVGGLALGAATGGAAMLGRASIGKLGDKLDKSTWVNKLAGGNNLFSKFAGNKLKDIGQGISKSSFDVRATKLGGMAGKGMDIDMGKAKEGGYIKDREDKVKRTQKRAKEIEVNEDEKLTQKVNKEEMDLQTILNTVAADFERIDKQIEAQQKNRIDFTRGSPEDLAAVAKIADLKREKKDIKDATGASAPAINAAATTARTNADTAATAAAAAPGNVALAKIAHDLEDTARNIAAAATVANASVNLGGRSINQREIEDIPNAKNARLTESRRRTTNYANNTAWWGWAANKEAQHKIIMETKIDSGAKT